MRRRDGFITSRYDQGQPLGAITACLYPYGTAFNCAGVRTLGAAAYRVIKISQAEIALVIGPGKPFRRHAANTLTTRKPPETGCSFWVRVIMVIARSPLGLG